MLHVLRGGRFYTGFMGGLNSSGWRLAALALAWLAGVAWHLQQPALWSWPACLLWLAVAVALMAVGFRARPGRGAFLCAPLGLAVISAVLANGQAAWRLQESLAPDLEGRDLVVTGVIASMPQRGASGLRFAFDVGAASLGDQAVHIPPALALGWYRGFHDDAALAQLPSELRAGQRWRFTVRLRQPHGNLNPYGFDYELFLFEQGVRATGYVRDGPTQRLADAVGHPVERLRQRVRDAIEARVASPREAGVLAALAVGDQAAIVVAVNKAVLV